MSQGIHLSFALVQPQEVIDPQLPWFVLCLLGVGAIMQVLGLLFIWRETPGDLGYAVPAFDHREAHRYGNAFQWVPANVHRCG